MLGERAGKGLEVRPFRFRHGGHTIRRVRPVTVRIGLTTYREKAAWGAWSETADLLSATYSDQVREAGGLPFLLPPGSLNAVADAQACVQSLDGLLLTGGADVDPARYGAVPHPTTDVPRVDRDEWELALARAAVAADLPVLAVCRGLQILNVALGGDLVQHLPDSVGHHDHRGQLGRFGEHRVSMATGTLLDRIYGSDADVPTHHHQAVGALGAGLIVTAQTEDGTVEAATCPGRAWVHGVQWHPEVADGQALFAAFVNAAAEHGALSSGAVAVGAS
jgi:putative glutamine amidotransferase